MALSGNYYQVIEVDENIYRLFSDEQVFMDLFVGSEKALLWDTGYAYADLRAAVREITSKPLVIINSHGHLDHTCGNGYFEEPVYIHEKDIPLCLEHTNTFHRQNAIDMAKHTVMYESNETKNILPKDFNSERYIQLGAGNLVGIREGQSFNIGNMSFEVYEFPGHTAGSIGLLYKEKNFLYVGDAMNPFVWLFAPEAQPLSVYIHSLKKAIDLKADKIMIAHGSGILSSSVLEDYLDCAENVDYEHGIPFTSPIFPDAEARICIRGADTVEEMFKLGLSSIVISKDKIDIGLK